ncbi:MAG: hypothetical protein LBI12_04505, partial [Treponema sp.]|nr:hypothetical protein [Treponema sp.]
MYPFPAGFIVLVSILLSSFFSIFTAALGACRKTRLEKEHKKLYRSALKTTENPEKLSLAC